MMLAIVNMVQSPGKRQVKLSKSRNEARVSRELACFLVERLRRDELL